jgi:hypothetical protein
MSLYLVKSEVHDGGHEYHDKFILLASSGGISLELPQNIDAILTAWEFGLTVKHVEESGDEVWSGCRVVYCNTCGTISNDHYDVVKKYLNVINLEYILDDVEYGDERDQEVA